MRPVDNVAPLTSVRSALVLKTAEYRRMAPAVFETARSAPLTAPTRTVRIKRRSPRANLTSRTTHPSPPRLTLRKCSSDMTELVRFVNLTRVATPAHYVAASLRAQKLRHPLLEGGTAPYEFRRKLSAWSQACAFKAPRQKGPGVTYALGRKNWLRENRERVRAASIKKTMEVHRERE